MGQTRYYGNRTDCDYDGPAGWNWFVGELPYAVSTGGSAAIVSDPNNPDWFDGSGGLGGSGGSYTPRYDMVDVALNDDGTNLTFTRTSNAQVETTVFNSFSAAQPGVFVSHTDARGVTTYAVMSGGVLTGLQRSYTIAGVTTVESIAYTYTSGGKFQTVTYSKQVGSGSPVPILQTTYAYYGASDLNGSLNDLQSAAQQIPDGSGGWLTVGIDYYRYYVAGAANGFVHGLKTHFGPEAVRLMVNAGINYTTAADSVLQPYADHYYEYDSSRRVIYETSAVCPSCTGGGTTQDSFTYAPSGFSTGYSTWAVKTVQTLPDSSQVIVYTNYVGQPILKVVIDPTGANQWGTFYRYDANDRLIWTAHPSAVALPASLSTLEAYPDLLNYNGGTGLYQYLNNSAGLIEVTNYYTTTGSGGVAGYVQNRQVQQGQSGTPVTLRAMTYASNTAGGNTIYPLASSTVYPVAGSLSTSYVTSYANTYYSGTNQLQQRTTTLPIVSAAQNGSGAADTTVDQFDVYGNRTQSTDERGIVNQYTFDVVMSVVTQQTLNVQSGVTQPGVNVVTSFAYDNRGRQTSTTGPSHTVVVAGAAVSVQPVTWTVYNQSAQPGSGAWGPDSTWSARGYFDGTNYTLIDPVSIGNTDKDGRSTDAIASHRTSGSGALSPTDTFAQTDWQTWSSTQYNPQHQTISSRVYFLIPASGDGTAGTNFGETDYGYDILERRNRVVAPGGTITRTVWTTPMWVASVWVGTNDAGATDSNPAGSGPPNNMVQVTSNVYDNGAIGDGNLTQQTQYVSATSGDTRVTSFGYDFRDRQTSVTGEINVYAAYTYDNLDRVTLTQNYNTSASGNLISQSGTNYDARGRAYQSLVYAVDPSTGTVGNVLTGNTWYDPSGNAVQQVAARAGQVFTKRGFNGVNWVTANYTGYNTSGTSYSQSQTVSGDIIVVQGQTTFDEVGNATSVANFLRLNDASATATGALTSSNARISYSASWFDGVDRSIAIANYGAIASFTRPSTPPASSSTVLVSQRAYNEAGWVYQTTDPNGIVKQTSFDNASRTTQTVEDVAGLARTTNFTYTLDSLKATMTAVNPTTGDQTTAWTYGTTLAASGVARNDLLVSITYPDSGPGYADLTVDEYADLDAPGWANLPLDTIDDVVSYVYNRLGERTAVTDQRGTVRSFVRDTLGRLTDDCVTTVGADTDSTVLRISTTYEVRGMPQTITSYDNATPGSGTALNQVYLTYNAFSQLTQEQQEHSGTVTGSTPSVGYAYDPGSGTSNEIRQTTLIYPNGRNISYSFGTAGGMNDLLNRVDTIQDTTSGTTDLASYTYLGLGTVVRITYPEPSVWLDLWGGTSGVFNGLDQFNRVIDQRWQNSITTTPTDIDRYQYGYDFNSNRLWKANVVGTAYVAPAPGFDELYVYDSINRLTQMQRGTLNGSHTAITGTIARQMNWTLDATGNWPGYVTQTSGSPDLNQARATNPVNEIGAITESVGPTWVTPTYDAAGNMLTMPQVADPTQSFAAVYDAWNRMTQIDAAGSASGQYQYDGRNRRIVAVTMETRHSYFTSSWQDVEERVGTSTNADTQSIWGFRYVDEIVLRDDASGGQLYACSDLIFSVTALVDSTGVRQRFEFDCYGCATVRSNSWSSSSDLFQWTVRFTGQRFDGESLLQLYRARYYSVVLGSFLSRDPLDADLRNLYEYVRSSPTMRVDPTGRLSWDFDEKNCIVTLNFRVRFYWEWTNGGLIFGTEARLDQLRKMYKAAVEAEFNQAKFKIYPSAGATQGAGICFWRARTPCPCPNGWTPKVDIDPDGNVFDFDAELSVIYQDHSMTRPGERSATFDSDFGSWTRFFLAGDNGFLYESTFSPVNNKPGAQIPAVHEFGHLLGLEHPGHDGITTVPPLPPSQWGQWPDYLADAPALMGTGMELRWFYYQRWADQLASKYRDCRPFQIR